MRTNVSRHSSRAAERTNGNKNPQSTEHIFEPQSSQSDSAFPYLGVILKTAKESPYLMLGIMISIAGIVVAAVVSITVGFGIFLFNMNGTMHEVKAQQATILQQLAKTQGDVDSTGNAMRAYEAANGKRAEYQIGLMTRDAQRAMNEYDLAHPLPRMPEKQRNE